MNKVTQVWVDEALLERAKTDPEAQYQLALLAIRNKRAGYAVALLKAAKKSGHTEASALLTTISNNLNED